MIKRPGITRSVLAENLKNYRKLNGLSLPQMATKCGISARHLSDIENQKCAASLDTLDKIEKGLNISSSKLVTPDYIKSPTE